MSIKKPSSTPGASITLLSASNYPPHPRLGRIGSLVAAAAIAVAGCNEQRVPVSLDDDTVHDAGLDTTVTRDGGIDDNASDAGFDIRFDSEVSPDAFGNDPDATIDTDTSTDAGTDTPGDAGFDGSDVGIDDLDTEIDSELLVTDTSAELDGSTDTGRDTGMDTAGDANPDTDTDGDVRFDIDTSTDTGMDTAGDIDTGYDGSPDAGIDAAGDTASDSLIDVGPVIPDSCETAIIARDLTGNTVERFGSLAITQFEVIGGDTTVNFDLDYTKDHNSGVSHWAPYIPQLLNSIEISVANESGDFTNCNLDRSDRVGGMFDWIQYIYFEGSCDLTRGTNTLYITINPDASAPGLDQSSLELHYYSETAPECEFGDFSDRVDITGGGYIDAITIPDGISQATMFDDRRMMQIGEDVTLRISRQENVFVSTILGQVIVRDSAGEITPIGDDAIINFSYKFEGDIGPDGTFVANSLNTILGKKWAAGEVVNLRAFIDNWRGEEGMIVEVRVDGIVSNISDGSVGTTGIFQPLGTPFEPYSVFSELRAGGFDGFPGSPK